MVVNQTLSELSIGTKLTMNTVMNALTGVSVTDDDTFNHQHDHAITSVVMIMATLPSPLALLACAMLVGGGARDLMGAATSAAGSGARFTKSFLNSVHALDPVAMLHTKHSNAQKTRQHNTAPRSTAQRSTAEMRQRES